MAKISKPEVPGAAPPAYLKSVHMRNYRSLRDVQASFKPGLNVIIGKNGSGKTNLVSLLGKLLAPNTEKQEGVGCKIWLSGGLDVNLTFEKPPAHPPRLVNGVPLQLTEPSSLTVRATIAGKQYVAESVAEAIGQGTEYNWYYYYNSITVPHGLPGYPLPIVEATADVAVSQEPLALSLLTSERAWRMVAQDNELAAMLFIFVLLELGVNVRRRGDEPTATLPAQRAAVIAGITTYLSRINALLPLYSPLQEVRCKEQVALYWNSEKQEYLLNGLALEYRLEQEWLPFQALSDGTKRLFFIFSKLFVADTTAWGEPLIPLPKIILLEEPELGIHPKQLNLLLQLIREVSKENQVILTTHSPQTLDMLTAQELDRITICEYVPGKGTQLRKLSAEKKRKARAYLKDEGFLSEFWRFSNLESPD